MGVRVGIAGYGHAGRAFGRALRTHPGFEWVALADPVAPADAGGVAVHDTLEAMLPHVDAVVIATPTPLHAPQALAALAAGRHVLLEKPMATTLADALAVADAAERAGRVLVVGHSHAHDAPMRAMRARIAAGDIGRLRIVQHLCHTDWMRRPRAPEEFDPAQGGGVTLRQGAHQFDVLRLLCGGLARSVRATCTPGMHAAFVAFEGDVAATAVYGGLGGLSTMDLVHDIGEWGQHLPPEARATRRGDIPGQAPFQPHFGFVLASGELGDLRQSPTGLRLHPAGGAPREIGVPLARSPRHLVLDEWHAAITDGQPPRHGARWGAATLELVLAALRSSAEGREIALQHQVPLGD